MESTGSGLRKIYERTRDLLKVSRELQSRENPSEADIEQLAFLVMELSELCPPERYAWIDGLPAIDIVAELTKIEDERRRKQMDAIEDRKNLDFKTMMKDVEPAVKEARDYRDSALGKFETTKHTAVSIAQREEELTVRIESFKKGEFAEAVEQGKSLEPLVRKSTEWRAELDALHDLREDIEDNRLPGAEAVLKRAEEELNRKAIAVVNEGKAAFQAELNRKIAEVEEILLAWPRAVAEVGIALKIKGPFASTGLRIGSRVVKDHIFLG
jgi:uncharacterized DUF497 family protein